MQVTRPPVVIHDIGDQHDLGAQELLELARLGREQPQSQIVLAGQDIRVPAFVIDAFGTPVRTSPANGSSPASARSRWMVLSIIDHSTSAGGCSREPTQR